MGVNYCNNFASAFGPPLNISIHILGPSLKAMVNPVKKGIFFVASFVIGTLGP